MPVARKGAEVIVTVLQGPKQLKEKRVKIIEEKQTSIFTRQTNVLKLKVKHL